MKLFFKMFLRAGMGALCSLFLLGCSHTVQGMKQDVREMGDSDTPKHTRVVRTTTVVKYQSPPTTSSSSLPTSPPPLETPAD